MRQLTKEEYEKITAKITKYISPQNFHTNYKNDDLVLHNQKLFHIPNIKKYTSSIARKDLVGAGVCLGKFTKTNQFRITITSLQSLSKFASHKVWVKTTSENNFLYGNDILKAHIQKMSDNIPINSNVFVFNMNDNPIGFGVMSRGSNSLGSVSGESVAVIRQSDCGEYLREQDAIF